MGIIDEEKSALAAKIETIRFYCGEGQWLPCFKCTPAAETIVEICSKDVSVYEELLRAYRRLAKDAHDFLDLATHYYELIPSSGEDNLRQALEVVKKAEEKCG